MTDQEKVKNLRNTSPQYGGKMFYQIKPGVNLKFPGCLKYPEFKTDGSFKNQELIIFCYLNKPYEWQKFKNWS